MRYQSQQSEHGDHNYALLQLRPSSTDKSYMASGIQTLASMKHSGIEEAGAL